MTCKFVEIDTLWNVKYLFIVHHVCCISRNRYIVECKVGTSFATIALKSVEIDTLWNVKSILHPLWGWQYTVEIDTLWNVKHITNGGASVSMWVEIDTLWNVKE